MYENHIVFNKIYLPQYSTIPYKKHYLVTAHFFTSHTPRTWWLLGLQKLPTRSSSHCQSWEPDETSTYADWLPWTRDFSPNDLARSDALLENHHPRSSLSDVKIVNLIDTRALPEACHLEPIRLQEGNRWWLRSTCGLFRYCFHIPLKLWYLFSVKPQRKGTIWPASVTDTIGIPISW